MLSYDVECPYCEAGQYIDHEDGYGYEEESFHEQQCGECKKTFTFTTSISYYYESYKAGCLNGDDHNWGKPRKMWLDEDKNKTLWSRGCKDCNAGEQGYNPEWAKER